MHFPLRILGLDILDLELTTDVTDTECEDDEEVEDFGNTDSTPIAVGFTPQVSPSIPDHIGDGEGGGEVE